MTKRVGDYCGTCPPGRQKEKLIRVNGALVCPHCDAVNEWTEVKRGRAHIERSDR